MVKLTKRQSEILEFIQNQIDMYGSPPTRAEIASNMGFSSPNAAEDHLRALARKGVIELLAGTSRGIRMSKQPGIPIIGRVAAGQPIFSEANIESFHKIEPSIFNPTADYLLRVKGLSMKDAGIMDGDLVAIHSTNIANQGQIVVVRIGEEVTVKRYYKEDHKMILRPENPSFSNIEIDLRLQDINIFIEGIVVGVIRVFQ